MNGITSGENIVFYTDGFVYLDTALSESAFSKTGKLMTSNERGVKAVKDFETGSWKTEGWSFEETEMNEKSRSVMWKARESSGCLLKDYLEGKDIVLKARASSLAIEAMEAVSARDPHFEGNGAGGIYIADDFSFVIFLPRGLFESSVTCRGEKILAEYEGFYSHENLYGSDKVHFAEAVIAYRALTGTFPYGEINQIKRHEDLFDRNFVPLCEYEQGIDRDLLAFVDGWLSIGVSEKGEKKPSGKDEALSLFPLKAFNAETGLMEDGSIPQGGKLNEVTRDCPLSEEDFTARNRKNRKAFESRLNKKRWFRHHKTPLAVTLGVCAVVAFCIVTYVSGVSSKPTTKGLTSSETLSMFYSAMNLLDVDSISLSSTGREGRRIADTVSNFYVSGKAVSVYDPSLATVCPAVWMLSNYEGKSRIYGLTQFTVDGKEASLFFKGKAKNTKGLKPLCEEDGTLLSEGDTKTGTASFYFLYTEDNENLHVAKRTDTVTLVYKGRRWLVKDIATEENDSIVSCSALYEDYRASLEKEGNDISRALELLRDKYEWLSTEREISEAQAYLEESSVL